MLQFRYKAKYATDVCVCACLCMCVHMWDLKLLGISPLPVSQKWPGTCSPGKSQAAHVQAKRVRYARVQVWQMELMSIIVPFYYNFLVEKKLLEAASPFFLSWPITPNSSTSILL